MSLLAGDEKDPSLVSELCYPRQVARTTVQQGSTITIQLWHLLAAKVELTCYLWGTRTGVIPSRDNNKTAVADPDLVKKLVNNEINGPSS